SRLRLCDPLRPRSCGLPERVALDRRAAQLGQRLVAHALQVRVRARQEVVLRLLETRARARDRRVADEVREETLRRIAAEVDGLSGLRPLTPLGCQDRPGGRPDQ